MLEKLFDKFNIYFEPAYLIIEDRYFCHIFDNFDLNDYFLLDNLFCVCYLRNIIECLKYSILKKINFFSQTVHDSLLPIFSATTSYTSC